MRRSGLAALLFTASIPSAVAYPIDGYDETGIRRLEYARKVVAGELSGTSVPVGARLPLEAVEVRLSGEAAPPPTADDDLGRAIARALGKDAARYGVAVYDLSDPAAPVYAEHRGDFRNNVGSVGKLLVALAWFQALADIWPDDVAARERLLRETVLAADEFVVRDHHQVLFFDPATGSRRYRVIVPGDRGSLYEWLDWMLSASNNGAAAFVQEQLMLLKAFGQAYPPTPEEAERWFREQSRAELSEVFLAAMFGPVSRNGLDLEQLRQGSFFTRTGNQRVPTTSSHGTPRELAKFLYRMERGQLVDEWSSREMKRLLYMTQRRIRYASHPVLEPYAVYFKSGSLYKCRAEAGFTCRQYEGNELNLLASTAIVEGPAPGRRLHYLVAVLSNVPKVNSAVAHQTLALRIHRLIEARHAHQAKPP